MALPDIRRRTGSVLLAVMVGHMILLSAQVKRRGVSLLETVTFGVFAELQRAASTGIGGLRTVWREYRTLREAQADNEVLRRQVGELRLRLQEQRTANLQTDRLRHLLQLRDRARLSTTAAEVIAVAMPDFRAVTIDKGTQDGLRRDLAVLSPAGVVGRVAVPSARTAKVQLLIDRNAAAAALIERSRAQGVVVGRGDGWLRLEYVADTADVRAGDLVVTSGIEGIYPKGFAIGRVDHVERRGTAYKAIVVRPAVDFFALEEVLVVLTPLVPEKGSEGAG